MDDCTAVWLTVCVADWHTDRLAEPLKELLRGEERLMDEHGDGGRRKARRKGEG